MAVGCITAKSLIWAGTRDGTTIYEINSLGAPGIPAVTLVGGYAVAYI